MNFLARFYFSPQGRTGRQAYWLFGVVPLVALGVVVGLVALYLHNHRVSPLMLLGLFALLSLWIGVALGSRRLHDIGVSAWWMVAVTVVPLLAALQLPQRWQQIPALLATIALGIPKGVVGSNRYGPDPTGGKS